ncbi:HNH endonuclease signature motif containing protein [Nocardioides koreensis]|uniref:HNH endonuclease signature motif containing protein n=1 Tax=Nocardioides koreensis TaxID=433651 RepID=A0ABN2ZXM8_9ACTN
MIETDNMGFPVVVEDLDADLLLELAEEAEIQCRAAERRKLRYVAQWCAVNPADDLGPASWSDAGGEAAGCDLRVGGDGTPAVKPFAAEQIGAALQISTFAATQLMSDVLDLQHRLPRIWRRVEDLEIPSFRARRIAQATSSLSRAAAAYVDAELAGIAGTCGPRRIERAVADAKAAFDPDQVADEEEQARASWGVTLRHGPADGPGAWAGTTWLEATGDTLDLTRFHDLVCHVAEQLRLDGDDSPLEIRKARALGVIADQASGAAGSSGPSARTRIYVHVSADDLDDPGALGAAERLGPVTMDRIRDWLKHSRATVVPVLDLASTRAIDRHDPDEEMRELVILRDEHCVFPWCETDARSCDLDHIVPYDEHGPPGQTNPENLAPLCRRHHRGKTARHWRYQRNADGSYTWHFPLGRSYRVTRTGTSRLR